MKNNRNVENYEPLEKNLDNAIEKPENYLLYVSICKGLKIKIINVFFFYR